MHLSRRLTLLSGCLVLFVYLTVTYTIGILTLTENQQARFRRSEGCAGSDSLDDGCGEDHTVGTFPPDPHIDTGGDQEGDKRMRRCDAEVEYIICQQCPEMRWCMDEEEKEIMDQKHAESTEKKKTWRKQCCLKVDEGGGCTDNDLKMAFCPR